jgi:hypothetical protein
MQDYEKLGVFYLGKRHDPQAGRTTDDLLLFDSRNLVTHALVAGMTGSGKTGLCFDIIEEAAIDGIPAIVIDPKGDLGNLLLTFPDLRPEDFAPWINEDEARKQGVSAEAYAAQQARLWQEGLAKWHQDGSRIQRLRDATEFTIYTPGSNAGVPVSLLKSFDAPPVEVREDLELMRERVGSTVAGLLGLIGMESDPVRSRDTILLSNLFQHAWSQGRNLDLGGLIAAIQQPPIQRLGVLDLETFYPAKERFALAMQLNNLLASPNFTAWMEGEPLEVGRFLHTPAGKPRVAIFSLAHLGDSERMFFVTLLLNQVLGWMRGQSGTGSLRALVYIDEIFGYFPPVANPPSKLPLLTLLKQARAFGVGVVLATQNPVDLDYKGLANIGTWFIGRLQTERDKARVLEGLEGAATGRGQAFDRAGMERLLAGLGKRVFLLHTVHAEGAEPFESRWALSYLRGPLNRAEIKRLSQAPVAAPPPPAARATAVEPPATAQSARPALPPQVPQFFAPARGASVPVGYIPRLVGAAEIRFVDAKLRVDTSQEVMLAAEIADRPVPVEWDGSEEVELEINELEKDGEGTFAPCAPAASQSKNYEKWARDFANHLYSRRTLTLWHAPRVQLVSRPEEAERDFRIRVRQALHEERDAAVEKLRARFAPKLAVLQERIRRAEAARERESAQATRAKLDTVISFGSTLLGAFLGRKVISASTVGRAATTMRSAGRSMDQAGDVTRANETIEALQKQLNDLDAAFREESVALAATCDSASDTLEPLELKPRKADIQVKLVALVWMPV